MIFFGDRKKIENAYQEWLKRNPEIADCPFNVISLWLLVVQLKIEQRQIFIRDTKQPKFDLMR